MSEEEATQPSVLYGASTNLQKFTGVLAFSFGVVACIMMGKWTSDHDLKKNFLGGLNDGRDSFNWHPLLMTIGTVFFMLTSLLSYRVVNLPKIYQKTLHSTLHTGALICLFLGLYYVLSSSNHKSKNSYDAYNANLFSLHSFLGLGVIILYGLNYVLAALHYTAQVFGEEWKVSFMPTHVFFGTFTMILSACAIMSGIMFVNSSCTYQVDQPDYNPAEHYHLLNSGCRLGNATGIVAMFAFFFCFYTIFRSGASGATGDLNQKLVV